jgi:hypothetical protein
MTLDLTAGRTGDFQNMMQFEIKIKAQVLPAHKTLRSRVPQAPEPERHKSSFRWLFLNEETEADEKRP